MNQMELSAARVNLRAKAEFGHVTFILCVFKHVWHLLHAHAFVHTSQHEGMTSVMTIAP